MEPTNKNWDVIVIGSGMGGMACAAALSKYGRRVLLIEQHYVAGGFTHTFSRKGFTWDVGVHCIGEMGEKDLPGKILRWLSDDGIKMQSLGKIYETFHFPGDFTITFPDTWREFKQNLIERFPHEKMGIEKYFDLIWKVSNSSKIFFAGKSLPLWADECLNKITRGKNRKWWELKTRDVIASLVADEKLKTVLTGQWGYYGSTPSESSFAIHALTIRHFWNGGYYPVDGSKTFADHLLKVIEKAGGQCLLRAPVDTILTKNNKAIGVRLQDGQEFFAKKTVSAAGARATVEKLVSEKYRNSTWGQNILKIKQSPPHICLHLGFHGDIIKAGATVSNQWFFDTWSNEDAYWNVNDPNSTADVLYMSFPSLKDPHHNPGPENAHTGEVVTFVPWEQFEQWQDTRRGKRTPEYRDFKKSIEDRLMAQLKKRVPELMKLVVFQELSTPLSTTFFTRAPQGAIYGLEATPQRFLTKTLRTRTPIKNLYLAGGDVATLGITGALVGGILAATNIEPRVISKLL